MRIPQIRRSRSALLAATLACAALLLVLPRYAVSQEVPAVLVQQGERYLAMGNYQAALNRYGKVIKCCEGTPKAAEAHNDMGVAWTKIGDLEKAREHYEAALRINRYPLALFNYARLLEKRWKDNGAGANGSDEADRAQAESYYLEFSVYLETGRNLPPSVEYQKEELQEHLRTALAGLAKP